MANNSAFVEPIIAGGCRSGMSRGCIAAPHRWYVPEVADQMAHGKLIPSFNLDIPSLAFADASRESLLLGETLTVDADHRLQFFSLRVMDGFEAMLLTQPCHAHRVQIRSGTVFAYGPWLIRCKTLVGGAGGPIRPQRALFEMVRDL